MAPVNLSQQPHSTGKNTCSDNMQNTSEHPDNVRSQKHSCPSSDNWNKNDHKSMRCKKPLGFAIKCQIFHSNCGKGYSASGSIVRWSLRFTKQNGACRISRTFLNEAESIKRLQQCSGSAPRLAKVRKVRKVGCKLAVGLDWQRAWVRHQSAQVKCNDASQRGSLHPQNCERDQTATASSGEKVIGCVAGAALFVRRPDSCPGKSVVALPSCLVGFWLPCCVFFPSVVQHTNTKLLFCVTSTWVIVAWLACGKRAEKHEWKNWTSVCTLRAQSQRPDQKAKSTARDVPATVDFEAEGCVDELPIARANDSSLCFFACLRKPCESQIRLIKMVVWTFDDHTGTVLHRYSVSWCLRKQLDMAQRLHKQRPLAKGWYLCKSHFPRNAEA